MFLMLGSRPDLCYSVNYFSRFLNDFTDETWMYLKEVLKYLKYIMYDGLIYTRKGSNPILECYVDSDWAADINDRKSVSGFFISN